ncbi:TBC domain-containing protein [Besnoitia besnoiti]|uniref:TBC domain-containing protein n=1 Tax=Besnoitia besnoiti TaxID=94643 RepID=A0A2A9M9C6_BESBE|nr:TBC domain-containing protein [Besnoitia besnoiti]PFH34499.1 TBC domain-containing protein [Besnoitia besnoiti]
MSFLWGGSSLISLPALGGTSSSPKDEAVPLQEASDRAGAPAAPAADAEELHPVGSAAQQQWRELDEVWGGAANADAGDQPRIGNDGCAAAWSSTVPYASMSDGAGAESGVRTPQRLASASTLWSHGVSEGLSDSSRNPPFLTPPCGSQSSRRGLSPAGDTASRAEQNEPVSIPEDKCGGAGGVPSAVTAYGVPSERGGAPRSRTVSPARRGSSHRPGHAASRSVSPGAGDRESLQGYSSPRRGSGDARLGSGDSGGQLASSLHRHPLEEGGLAPKKTGPEPPPPHVYCGGRTLSMYRKTVPSEELQRGRDADTAPHKPAEPREALSREERPPPRGGGGGGSSRRSSPLSAGSVPAPSESLLQQRQNNRRQQQELLQSPQTSTAAGLFSSFSFSALQRPSDAPSGAASGASPAEEMRGVPGPARARRPPSPQVSPHDRRAAQPRASRETADQEEAHDADPVAPAEARAARRKALLQQLFGVKNSASGERGERKWQSMEDRNLVHFMQMHRHTFFRRLRRGVPPSHRWNAWKAVCLPPPERRCSCSYSSLSFSGDRDCAGSAGASFHPQSPPLISCVSSPAAGGVGSALARRFSGSQRQNAEGSGGGGARPETHREGGREEGCDASSPQAQSPSRGGGCREEAESEHASDLRGGRGALDSWGAEVPAAEGKGRRRATLGEERDPKGQAGEDWGCCGSGGDCRRVYEREAERRSSFFGLIMIDVPRTFPDVEVFDKDAQALLCRTLNAFANIHPEVGYCQGMNFIAGLLLLVSSFEEFDAFCVFRALMQRYRLKGFFQEKFPLLRKYMKVFDTLAAQQLPELRQHFLDEGVLPAVYLHQWFLTLFVTSLPLRSVCVLWDFLLGEGLHGLLELAVALLKVLTRFIIHLRFEEVIKFLKSLKSSGGGCDDFKVGKMLVKQAAKVQLPELLLTDLLTADLAVLLREAEEEEAAEAQARAAGAAAAAAAAAVPEGDSDHSNPLVGTLTGDEDDEDGDERARPPRPDTRGGIHGGATDDSQRRPQTELSLRADAREKRRAERPPARREQEREQSGEEGEEEDEPEIQEPHRQSRSKAPSSFSSWDELPSPGRRGHARGVSGYRRSTETDEEEEAAGEERGGRSPRAAGGRQHSSSGRRREADSQREEEMQVLRSSRRKKHSGHGPGTQGGKGDAPRVSGSSVEVHSAPHAAQCRTPSPVGLRGTGRERAASRKAEHAPDADAGERVVGGQPPRRDSDSPPGLRRARQGEKRSSSAAAENGQARQHDFPATMSPRLSSAAGLGQAGGVSAGVSAAVSSSFLPRLFPRSPPLQLADASGSAAVLCSRAARGLHASSLAGSGRGLSSAFAPHTSPSPLDSALAGDAEKREADEEDLLSCRDEDKRKSFSLASSSQLHSHLRQDLDRQARGRGRASRGRAPSRGSSPGQAPARRCEAEKGDCVASLALPQDGANAGAYADRKTFAAAGCDALSLLASPRTRADRRAGSVSPSLPSSSFPSSRLISSSLLPPQSATPSCPPCSRLPSPLSSVFSGGPSLPAAAPCLPGRGRQGPHSPSGPDGSRRRSLSGSDCGGESLLASPPARVLQNAAAAKHARSPPASPSWQPRRSGVSCALVCSEEENVRLAAPLPAAEPLCVGRPAARQRRQCHGPGLVQGGSEARETLGHSQEARRRIADDRARGEICSREGAACALVPWRGLEHASCGGSSRRHCEVGPWGAETLSARGLQGDDGSRRRRRAEKRSCMSPSALVGGRCVSPAAAGLAWLAAGDAEESVGGWDASAGATDQNTSAWLREPRVAATAAAKRLRKTVSVRATVSGVSSPGNSAAERDATALGRRWEVVRDTGHPGEQHGKASSIEELLDGGERERDEGAADALDRMMPRPGSARQNELRRSVGRRDRAEVQPEEDRFSESEAEGFFPCERLTGAEREAAVAMRLVEASPLGATAWSASLFAFPQKETSLELRAKASCVVARSSELATGGGPSSDRALTTARSPGAEGTPLGSRRAPRGQTGAEQGGAEGLAGVLTGFLSVDRGPLRSISSSPFLSARTRGAVAVRDESSA